MVMETTPPLGFHTAIQRSTDSWSAEFRIDESLLTGWDHAARLAIQVTTSGSPSTAVRWPESAPASQPAEWASAWLGTLPPQPNLPPVAVVPEQIVLVASDHDAVVLDGSASRDPDGDPLNFAWVQTAGPGVDLVDAGSSRAWFAPPAVDSLVTMAFELTVDDGSLGSTPVTTTVLLIPDPEPFVREGTAGSAVLIREVRVQRASEQVELHGVGQPGRPHEVLRSEDGMSWGEVGTVTAGMTGRFDFAEPLVPGATVILYRVRLQP
jgi:hypothetical protein